FYVLLSPNLHARVEIVCMLLLLVLRVLQPPPFPYPSLFRSDSSVDGILHGAKLHRLAVHECFTRDLRAVRPAEDAHGQLGAASTDRKSTRLNSSHVKIPYAVFCLKKKNNRDGTKLAHRHQVR